MRSPRRLRSRLFVAMVGIALGVLVTATVGAAFLAQRTAESSARRDLEERAPEYASLAQRLQRAFASGGAAADTQTVETVVRLLAAADVSLLLVNGDGSVDRGVTALAPPESVPPGERDLLDLPPGMRLGELDLIGLVAGFRQSGRDGDRVFVAQPVESSGDATPVVVLTKEVSGQPLGRAGPFLIGTGAAALVVAAFVAGALARRMTNPIAAMQGVAHRIADGDLAARVDVGTGAPEELDALARSLNRMTEELDAARGAQRAFLMSISHDLRTPLTSIRGYAEAIADGVVADDDGRRRAAEIIRSEAERLAHLVADLLDLARLDSRQFSLHPRAVDARELVTRAVEGFLPAAARTDLTLTVEPGEPIPADIDPERLGQMVGNLVENALTYAARRVTVTVAGTDGVLTVCVDDDGPGVPDGDETRVFERLYSARGPDARPEAGRAGTGIGLAIVHELATAMGGTASCTRLDGSGTRFTISVPRQ